MTKISIINCSTRKKGRTSQILNPFIEGLSEKNKTCTTPGGNKVKTYQLSEWDLKKCKGCSYCWFKKPGICKINDDFSKNISKIVESELIIFSSPIWVGAGTHILKIFTERFFSIINPFFVKTNNYYGHTRISTHKIQTFLVSTCALPGLHNFNAIIQQIKALDYLCDFQYAGQLLKPQSLELDILNKTQLKDLSDNSFNTGKYFFSDKILSIESANLVSNPYLDTEEYISFCNQKFEKQIHNNSL